MSISSSGGSYQKSSSLPSLKNVSIKDLLNVSYWLWRLNPLSAFPVIFNSALETVKKSIIIIVLLFSFFQLISTGFIKEIADNIAELNFPRLVIIFSYIIYNFRLETFTIILIYYAISVITGGFLNSAEYGSYLRLVKNGTISFKNIFEEIKTKWLKMAKTVFIVEFFKIIPIVIALTAITLHTTNLIYGNVEFLSSMEISRQIILWHIFVIIAGISTTILSILTVYAYPAAVDGSYGLTSIKKSISTFSRIPADTLLYCFLRVISNISIGIILAIVHLISVQLSLLLALILNLIIIPVFHIFKTILFFKAKPDDNILPLPLGPPVFQDMSKNLPKDVIKIFKKGLKNLIKFLIKPKNIVFYIISVLFLFLGIPVGKNVSPSSSIYTIHALSHIPSITNLLFSSIFGFPLVSGLYFNNWQVSLSMIISGIAFIIPILITLFLNGLTIGMLKSIIQNNEIFLKTILSHSIIELPIFIITSSIGLSLGFEFLSCLIRGNISSNTVLHDDLKRAINIIIGLIPLFIVGKIIEAFITNLIMRI